MKSLKTLLLVLAASPALASAGLSSLSPEGGAQRELWRVLEARYETEHEIIAAGAPKGFATTVTRTGHASRAGEIRRDETVYVLTGDTATIECTQSKSTVLSTGLSTSDYYCTIEHATVDPQ